MYRIVSIHDLPSEHLLDSLKMYSFLLFPVGAGFGEETWLSYVGAGQAGDLLFVQGEGRRMTVMD